MNAKVALRFGYCAIFFGCLVALAGQAQEHPMAMKMALAPVTCTTTSDPAAQLTEAQKAIIISTMKDRDHRLHHALWHAIRAGLTGDQETQVVEAFGKTWSDLHNLCSPTPPNARTSAKYNPAGEDFLYMHRLMVNEIRSQLEAAKVPCIGGWDHIPNADDANFPVPGASKDGPKSDSALALMQKWDTQFFHNDKWLSTHSLSEVGFALEFTLHNNLHMRFAEDRPLPRYQADKPEDDGAPIPFDGKFPNGDSAYPNGWRYDEPGYDWLADPYGAAVNPTFWKIHGYVDNVIDAWARANGMGNANAYDWQGKWTGMPDSHRLPPGAKRPPTRREIDDMTEKFRELRMAHQRIGLITEFDLNRSARRSGHDGFGKDEADPDDPLAKATAAVCSSH